MPELVIEQFALFVADGHPLSPELQVPGLVLMRIQAGGSALWARPERDIIASEEKVMGGPCCAVA